MAQYDGRGGTAGQRPATPHWQTTNKAAEV